MFRACRHGIPALAVLLAATVLVPGCGSDEVTDPEQWPVILLDVEEPIERRREAATKIRLLAQGRRRALVADTLLTVIERDTDQEVRLRALASIRRIGPFTEVYIKKLQAILRKEKDPVVKYSLRSTIAALIYDTQIRPGEQGGGPRTIPPGGPRTIPPDRPSTNR